MSKFGTQKFYSLTVGIILFCFGFFGFAFRGNSNIPDYYLLIGLILGFWGIVVGTKK
jgi:hypothetical protein